MKEQDILTKLRANFDHDYVLTNSYVFPWESDYFGFSKSGYVYEIEVKISISDFRADFKKEQKHLCLNHNTKSNVPRIRGEQTEMVVCGSHTRGRRVVNDYKRQNKGYCGLSYMENQIPNRFFYAVPESIADKAKELLPNYAGLIIVGDYSIVEKQAPMLHRNKLFDALAKKLLSKFYWLSERQRAVIGRARVNK